jgi:hypothetical protein
MVNQKELRNRLKALTKARQSKGYEKFDNSIEATIGRCENTIFNTEKDLLTPEFKNNICLKRKLELARENLKKLLLQKEQLEQLNKEDNKDGEDSEVLSG